MLQKRDVIFASLQQLHQLNDEDLRFPVVGDSMWPTLRSGDEVIIQSTDSYYCGDLLLFNNDQTLIVHRLLKIGQSGQYVTKGDNRREMDASFAADQLLGRVTTIIRNGKTIPVQRKKQYIFHRFLQFSWVVSAFYRRLAL